MYQLLRAAAQCHGKGVCHGDIKSENVLVTSGNWLLLTDFAPFKPTLLPVRGFLFATVCNSTFNLRRTYSKYSFEVVLIKRSPCFT